MSHAPVPCMFLAGVFYPLGAYKRLAAENYGDGEIVTMAPVESRSMASHRFFFAVVNKAWQNLPEELGERFASAEHLRKHALIKGGFRTEQTTVFSSPEDAARAAALLESLDGFSIVVVHGCSVTRWIAESQSIHDMGKERFEASKEAVLNVLAALIGVDPTTLLTEADHTT